MGRISHLEGAMKDAERVRVHKVRVARPHLAHEYRDEKRSGDEIESITHHLLPHARRCAEGRARPHVVFAAKTRRERILNDEAKRNINAAWEAAGR